MPRYDDHDAPTRLYVGRISTRTRSRDLENLFSKYGRIREVDVKSNFAFVEFNAHRDADDARHYLDGKEFEGHRIVVEFARESRRSGGTHEYLGRGPTPGTGRCYNCGNEGHWARDCKSGDVGEKCFRCGERGHIARNCRNSPRSSDRSPRRRSRSRTLSSSRSRSRSDSPNRNDGSALRESKKEHKRSRSRSLTPNPLHLNSHSKSSSPIQSASSESRETESTTSQDSQKGS